MAKSTIGGKSKGTSGEIKARRAPVRRRGGKKTTDVTAVVASAADLARAGAKAKTRTTPPTASTRDEAVEFGAVGNPSPEEVQRRAYEIYVRRGGTGGDAREDWYEAERELRERTH